MLSKEKFQELKKNHPFVVIFLFLYLGFLIIYIIVFQLFYADYSKPMPLNEIGDFLAGVFSPLAFLFLYLGYKQNSESLKHQINELSSSTQALKEQVEYQADLVRISTDQLNFYREKDKFDQEQRIYKARPILILIRISSGTSGDRFTIKNLGGDANFIKSERPPIDIPSLPKNGSKIFTTPYRVDFLTLNYSDSLNNSHTTFFEKGETTLSMYVSKNIPPH